jgi:hypothetical protein
MTYFFSNIFATARSRWRVKEVFEISMNGNYLVTFPLNDENPWRSLERHVEFGLARGYNI